MQDNPQADLADEIAEAISDTLDMDWQPSWAAPNIITIINRERRLARLEGAKAMQTRAIEQIENWDGELYCTDELTDAIAALDPAQIAGGKP